MKEVGHSEFLSPVEQEATLRMLSAVRNTTTLEGNTFVYRYAMVTLQRFEPDELYPTAKYVVESNLEMIDAIRGYLLRESSTDIFKLRSIFDRDGIVIAPPLIEMSDGVPAIVDGIHRCYLAREMGIPINGIFVVGADRNVPLISVPVTWDQVRKYRVKPEEAHLLRDIRPGVADASLDIRRHYRDLGFLGGKGRRPRRGQSD